MVDVGTGRRSGMGADPGATGGGATGGGRRHESGRPARKSPTAYRTISEVSDELDIPQHVLRFWETKFAQVRPLKRGGGRRYYRPEDVTLLRRIQALLYKEGYTIKGVQKLLREGRAAERAKAVLSEEEKTDQASGQGATLQDSARRDQAREASGEPQVRATTDASSGGVEADHAFEADDPAEEKPAEKQVALGHSGSPGSGPLDRHRVTDSPAVAGGGMSEEIKQVIGDVLEQLRGIRRHLAAKDHADAEQIDRDA